MYFFTRNTNFLALRPYLNKDGANVYALYTQI
jgi:hypothetical protein